MFSREEEGERIEEDGERREEVGDSSDEDGMLRRGERRGEDELAIVAEIRRVSIAYRDAGK